MSPADSALERTLAHQLVAISVSDSPDLGRLGLLERSLHQTVAALATRLVCRGARIVYGGNLNQKGYTYQLYPAIAQAYATAALRSARPPFVHYVAAYLAQDPAEVAAHLKAVGGFAEVRLVDCDRGVTNVVTRGNELIWSPSKGDKRRLTDLSQLPAFVADTRPQSGGRAVDLDAMREVMEDAVTARITIGGRVTGYGGSKPGVLQEALLALEKNHSVFTLGGFGGASRDAAIALGLVSHDDALEHKETGPGYIETISAIAKHVGKFQESAKATGAWDDLVAASKAEDPETASTQVIRALMHGAKKGR
jgi:hypothetical protein